MKMHRDNQGTDSIWYDSIEAGTPFMDEIHKSNGLIKILVTDDHAISRVGLAEVLDAESDMTVVGQAIDGEDAIQKTVELGPDVIVMDVLMPQLDGMEALAYIKQYSPECLVLMLSISEREDYLLRALRLGANGYLSKSAGIPEIVDAVRAIAHGEMVFSPQVAHRLMEEVRAQHRLPDISKREYEVMELLGEGCNNSQIAEMLTISESSVRTYLHRLMRKLRFANRTELVAYAIHHHFQQESSSVSSGAD